MIQIRLLLCEKLLWKPQLLWHLIFVRFTVTTYTSIIVTYSSRSVLIRVGQHVPQLSRSLTRTRKLCVRAMKRPDISNPTLQSPSVLPPPPPRPPLHPPLPQRPNSSRQLRHTCEQKLLSALQDDRVTLSRHRGCVNVWFGMWEPAMEDTGSGPGAAALRKSCCWVKEVAAWTETKPLFSASGFEVKS